jgi:glutaryl-CoA dehydrogenase
LCAEHERGAQGPEDNAAMITDQIVTEDVGKALGTDYLLIRPDLTEAERGYLDRTRRFVEDEVLPVIGGYWERAELPLDLVHRLGELGLVGDGIEATAVRT